MRKLCSFCFALLFVGSSIGPAAANTFNLWRVGTDILPCSRQTSYRDDFGIEWPTIQTASQTAYASIDVTLTADNVEDAIVQRIKDCGAAAAAATGGAVAATDGAGLAAAKEIFGTTFWACLKGTTALDFVQGVNMNTYSECNW